MARIDTLPHFLTDVADAIRTKDGTSGPIQASNFDTAIANLPGGGKYAPRYISFYNYSGSTLDDEIEGLDLSNTTTMSGMFQYCTNLETLDLSSLDTSTITSMSNLVNNDTKLTTIDMTGLDVSNVTNMTTAFYNCPALTSIIGFNDLVFSSGDELARAFSGSKITNITLNCGEKHTVTTITSIFESCTELVSATIIGASCANWASTFSGCSKLTQVTFTNCDIKPSNYGGYVSTMFQNCSSLTSVDVSWIDNSSKNLNMSRYMFSGCTSLMHIDMRNFDFSKAGTSTQMFGASASNGPPDNCEIIVKDQTQKTWLNTNYSRFTNVKTVAEYEAE